MLRSAEIINVSYNNYQYIIEMFRIIPQNNVICCNLETFIRFMVAKWLTQLPVMHGFAHQLVRYIRESFSSINTVCDKEGLKMVSVTLQDLLWHTISAVITGINEVFWF